MVRFFLPFFLCFHLLSFSSLLAQDEVSTPFSDLYDQERFDRLLSVIGTNPEQATPDQAFWMGMGLKRKGEYRSALDAFEKATRSTHRERAAAEMKACRKAIEWKKEPVCEVEALEAINSSSNESSPAWGDPTFTTLLFTRSQGKKGGRNEDMMVTDKREHGYWKEAASFEKGLNSPAHELSLSIDPKSGEGFFSRCKERRCHIRRIERKSGVWKDRGELHLLQPCAPDSVNLTHPAYHSESQRLYFSSDMPGGEGGFDIWYIEKDSVGGGWTDPVNAGTSVNSSGDEIFPSVRVDGRLYFSSDGHAGMGGMDIFRAKRDGIGGHEDVRNLGYPINSEGNDTRIIFEGKHMRGFFSSDRGGKQGERNDDLYRFFKKT